MWKAGWKLDSDPAPSLLCCLLGAPKAGVPFVSGTPVPWVGKRGGKAWGLERLPPLVATVTEAGGTALNPIPLSFRTNTTMLSFYLYVLTIQAILVESKGNFVLGQLPVLPNMDYF